MTSCAFYVAALKTRTLHDAQRLKTNIADIILVARRRLEAMTLAAKFDLSQMIELARINRQAMTVGMVFSSYVAADALHAGREAC